MKNSKSLKTREEYIFTLDDRKSMANNRAKWLENYSESVSGSLPSRLLRLLRLSHINQNVNKKSTEKLVSIITTLSKLYERRVGKWSRNC